MKNIKLFEEFKSDNSVENMYVKYITKNKDKILGEFLYYIKKGYKLNQLKWILNDENKFDSLNNRMDIFLNSLSDAQMDVIEYSLYKYEHKKEDEDKITKDFILNKVIDGLKNGVSLLTTLRDMKSSIINSEKIDIFWKLLTDEDKKIINNYNIELSKKSSYTGKLYNISPKSNNDFGPTSITHDVNTFRNKIRDLGYNIGYDNTFNYSDYNDR